MPNEKPRVLIIDGDEELCRLMVACLERADFEVVCAHSAAEGLRSALQDSIDVVIVDHLLPEHDGLTLLAALQAHKEAPPAVYLTGNQDSRVAVAALKAGATDYVAKDADGYFPLLLENAVTNALFTTAIRRDKEKAEAEMRAARDQFKALAEERALLLREVNHRISNSLQLIASVLHFQGDISGNADVKAALNEATGRVLAVARVHRSLYNSLDVKWISLAGYLSDLIGDLVDATAGRSPEESVIAFSSDPIHSGPDTAVAVGMITTELVLNALKHAYRDGQGPVRVFLRAAADRVELAVEDDGAGGLHADSGQRRGLGQRIVAGMTDKLNGALRYEKLQQGTRAVVTFPLGENVRVADNMLACNP